MFNHHKIISLILGLLFMVVLQIFSTPLPIFRFLLPAFIGLLLLTFFYNQYYLKKINRYNFWVVIRPALLQSSGFLLYLLLPGPLSRGVFFIATVAIIAIAEMALSDFSENVLMNETLLAAFGFNFAFFGFMQYFTGFTFLLLLAGFLAMFLLARCFYEFVPHNENVKLLNALVVSSLGAEIFWVASFLPFHFSALAILVLSLFYIILVLNYFFLFNALTQKKIKFYLTLTAISFVLVLGITPWRIIK